MMTSRCAVTPVWVWPGATGGDRAHRQQTTERGDGQHQPTGQQAASGAVERSPVPVCQRDVDEGGGRD